MKNSAKWYAGNKMKNRKTIIKTQLKIKTKTKYKCKQKTTVRKKHRVVCDSKCQIVGREENVK